MNPRTTFWGGAGTRTSPMPSEGRRVAALRVGNGIPLSAPTGLRPVTAPVQDQLPFSTPLSSLFSEEFLQKRERRGFWGGRRGSAWQGASPLARSLWLPAKRAAGQDSADCGLCATHSGDRRVRLPSRDRRSATHRVALGRWHWAETEGFGGGFPHRRGRTTVLLRRCRRMALRVAGWRGVPAQDESLPRGTTPRCDPKRPPIPLPKPNGFVSTL